jgi:putative ABC transport system permease protein
MFLNNLKHSLKSLRRSGIFSILNILGLATGFSVVTLIVLYLVSEYTRDYSIPNHDNIYRLYTVKHKQCALDYNLTGEILDKFPEIENGCAVRTFFGFDIPLASKKNLVVEKKVFLTTNEFFDIFNVHVVKSLATEPLPDKESAVITQSFASRLFPGEEALGKRINLFGFAEMTVQTIVEDFADKSLNCNFITHAENPDFRNLGMTNHYFNAAHYFVLRKNTDISSLNLKLSELLSEKEYGPDSTGLQKLNEIYLNSAGMEYNAHESGNKRMLRIFLAVSFLILLLSVINNFNHNLSLQYSNLKEIGVRKTNGAGKTQILGLFITDSFVRVLVSVVVSGILTYLVLPLLTPFFQHPLKLEVLFGPVFILGVSGLFILLVLLNSLASILVFSKFNIKDFLSGGISKSKKYSWKNVLIIFQLTISLVLLISLIVIKKQISFVKHSETGFDRENIVRVNFPIGIDESKAVSFKNRIGDLAFVRSVSLSNGVPGMINHTSSSNEKDNDFSFVDLIVDADFLKTLGIDLKAGRDFRKGENNNVCIINETALKKYGWDDFAGRHFKGWGDLEIIGISSDFNISSLHTLPVPVSLIFGDRRDDYAQLSIRLSKGNTSEMLGAIEKEWQSMFSNLPFYYTFYDQFFDAMYKNEERTASLLSLFSLIAFLITCMGILGVSFQNSLNRAKEIGVRKVNGARVTDVLLILNRDFLMLTLIAVIVATPLAYLIMNIWLQEFAYRTSLAWWIFILAITLTFTVVTGTVTMQTIKTAKLNPVDSLKYE